MMTFASKNTRELAAIAPALALLAGCRHPAHGAWCLVLAVVPRPSPQLSAPAADHLDLNLHDRTEEEAERWDGLS